MASTALARKQEQHKDLRAFLSQDGIKQNLAMALPKHMTPDRMVRIALSAASKNDALLKCSQESVAKSLILASEMGLEPNGVDAALVPYGTDATFIPMYQGLVKLAYQSSLVRSCMAKAVYSNDHFRYKLGTQQFVDHVPCDGEDRGELKYAWAMAELSAGGTVLTVLNKAEVDRHRKSSKTQSRSDSPWNQFPEAMWAKTAFKELAKWIPKSPQLQRAVQHDDIVEFGDPMVFDSTPARATTSPANAMLGNDTPEPQPEPEANDEAEQSLMMFIQNVEQARTVEQLVQLEQDFAADRMQWNATGKKLADDAVKKAKKQLEAGA